MTLLTLALACGVADETPLRDLDHTDWDRLCHPYYPQEVLSCSFDDYTVSWSIGGAGCPDDLVRFDPDALPDGCDATAGEWRTCYDATIAAIAENACAPESPEECDALAACLSE